MLTTAILTANGLYYNNETSKISSKLAQVDKEIEIRVEKFAIIQKKKQLVPINLPGAATINAIFENYELDSSIWKIVNKNTPLSMDYIPTSIKIPNVSTRTDKSVAERSVRSDIEQPLIQMFQTATSEGIELMIGSAYRSAALQKVYFDSLASAVGETAANQSIAYPGQSEHQTGLAVDISTVSRECYLDNCFATTGGGQWLTDNSYKFGFILRYPSGKESITGYRYESWHFRYVGIALATALHESGLTLDEAEPYLQAALKKLHENGAV